jgi:hypothetical protein
MRRGPRSGKSPDDKSKEWKEVIDMTEDYYYQRLL